MQTAQILEYPGNTKKENQNKSIPIDTKICKNTAEVINSPSFFSVFELILSNMKDPRIVPSYYLDILNKILYKKAWILNEKERLDFTSLLDNEVFISKAKKYYAIFSDTNNLEINNIGFYDIKKKLISEVIVKKVNTALETKKEMHDIWWKTNKIIDVSVDWDDYMMFSSFIEPWKRIPPIKVVEKVWDKYLCIQSWSKMCFLNKINFKKIWESHDYVWGWIEINDGLYFKIIDDWKSYVYYNWEILGPYPNIWAIKLFQGKIYATIEVSKNKTLLDLKTEEIYYITMEGKLKKKTFEYKEHLLDECYFDNFSIELLEIEWSDKLLTPLLKCEHWLNTTFIRSLREQPKKWKRLVTNIIVDTPKLLRFDYESSYLDYRIFKKWKGKFKV